MNTEKPVSEMTSDEVRATLLDLMMKARRAANRQVIADGLRGAGLSEVARFIMMNDDEFQSSAEND